MNNLELNMTLAQMRTFAENLTNMTASQQPAAVGLEKRRDHQH